VTGRGKAYRFRLVAKVKHRGARPSRKRKEQYRNYLQHNFNYEQSEKSVRRRKKNASEATEEKSYRGRYALPVRRPQMNPSAGKPAKLPFPKGVLLLRTVSNLRRWPGGSLQSRPYGSVPKEAIRPGGSQAGKKKKENDERKRAGPGQKKYPLLLPLLFFDKPLAHLKVQEKADKKIKRSQREGGN